MKKKKKKNRFTSECIVRPAAGRGPRWLGRKENGMEAGEFHSAYLMLSSLYYT